MKINNNSVMSVSNYSQVSNAYNRQKTIDIRPSLSSDKVELSDTAQFYSSYIKELKGSAMIDEAKYSEHVNNIANQIESGTYKLDPYKVASKLLSSKNLKG